MRYQRAEIPAKLDGVAAARESFSGFFGEQDPSRECIRVAHLDEESRCLHLSHHGGDTSSVDSLREIVIDAALFGSTALLLTHNHPSGDARPSESDLRSTRRLATVAKALDCTLVDHLVFAGSDCTSLRRLGYL